MLVRPVPPPPPTFNAVAFANTYAPGDGNGSFDVTFTLLNAVGGETVDVAWEITAGDPITTLTTGNNNGNATSPITTSTPLGANAYGQATVRLYSSGAILLDTRVLTNQLLPA